MNRGKWFARGCGPPPAMPGWGTRRGVLNYQILVSNSFSDEKRVYPKVRVHAAGIGGAAMLLRSNEKIPRLFEIEKV